jgi:hypothetical protein
MAEATAFYPIPIPSKRKSLGILIKPLLAFNAKKTKTECSKSSRTVFWLCIVASFCWEGLGGSVPKPVVLAQDLVFIIWIPMGTVLEHRTTPKVS